MVSKFDLPLKSVMFLHLHVIQARLLPPRVRDAVHVLSRQEVCSRRFYRSRKQCAAGYSSPALRARYVRTSVPLYDAQYPGNVTCLWPTGCRHDEILKSPQSSPLPQISNLFFANDPLVFTCVSLGDGRNAARNDFKAGLMAYKRRELMETLSQTSTDSEFAAGEPDNAADEGDPVGVVDSAMSSVPSVVGHKLGFRAAGALMFPGLDRGRVLWEEDSYQSSLLLQTVPVPLGGFFTNGVAGMNEVQRSTIDSGFLSARRCPLCNTWLRTG